MTAQNEMSRRTFWLIIAALFLLAIAARVLFILYPVMDSDMAIVGLQGMHFMEGKFFTMFYGQDYGSAFLGYIAAVLFSLFGVSRYALNSIAPLLSMLYLTGIYLTARRVMPRTGALIALGLACLGPFYLIWHSVLARALNIETITTGVWIMYVTLRVFKLAPGSKAYNWHLGLFGFLSGLVFWFHGLGAYFFLPCGLLLWRNDPRLIIRPAALLALLGFFVGVSPLLHYNLTHDWGTYYYLTSPRPQDPFLTSLIWAAGKGFGTISGSTQPGTTKWFLPGVSQVFWLISLLAVLGALVIWGKDLWLRMLGDSKAKGGEVFFMVFLTISLLYAILGGSSSNSARYLLAWYAVLPLMLAQSLYWLMQRGRIAAKAAWVLVIGLGIYYAAGDVLTSHFMLPADRKIHIGYRLDAERQAEFWNRLGVRYVYDYDYWRSMRATFDAKEKVVFVVPGGTRYKPYWRSMVTADKCGFVVLPQLAELMSMTLDSLGASYEKTRPEGIRYMLFHSIKPPATRPTLLPPQGYSAVGRPNSHDVAQAFDLNAGTRYSPLAGQVPGQGYTLDLGRVQDGVCQLLLYCGFSHDQPNRLRVESSRDGKSWSRVIEYSNLRFPYVWNDKVPVYIRRTAWQEIRFSPRPVRYIRLTQTGKLPQWYWSLTEIMVGAEAANPAPVPDYDRAAAWLAQKVPGRVKLWCEPGLMYRLPRRLWAETQRRKKPAWLREYVFPEQILPLDGPLHFAVIQSRLDMCLAILEGAGWKCETDAAHGVALIKAAPPEPQSSGPQAADLGLKPAGGDRVADLGKVLEFSRVELNGDILAAVGRDALKLAVSLDGENYTPLKTRPRWHGQLMWAGIMPLACRTYPLILLSDPVQARYVKVSKVLPEKDSPPGELSMSVW